MKSGFNWRDRNRIGQLPNIRSNPNDKLFSGYARVCFSLNNCIVARIYRRQNTFSVLPFPCSLFLCFSHGQILYEMVVSELLRVKGRLQMFFVYVRIAVDVNESLKIFIFWTNVVSGSAQLYKRIACFPSRKHMVFCSNHLMKEPWGFHCFQQ